jgi:hypothetical protein
MKRIIFLSASVIALALSFATSATAQTFKETATCKFTNTAAGKTLYEGRCTVKQSASGNNTIFSIKMGDSEPFLFAGVRGQKNWMHGADNVQFTDAPGGGIFRWSTFALVVAEGDAASSSSSDGGAAAVNSGETPADLRDLVNGRRVGGEVDDEMIRRGYKQARNQVQGDEVYSYWRKSSDGRCVVVHFDASRHVSSIASAFDSSCQ